MARGWLGPVVLTLVVGEIVRRVMPSSGWDQPRLAAVFIALAAIVLALRPAAWLWATLALAVAWWMALVLARYLPNVINPAPPVGQAVGGAALDGTPYTGSEIGAVLSVAIPAVLALASLRLAGRGRRRSDAEPAAAAATPGAIGARRTRHSALVLWVGLALIALVLAPDLEAYLMSQVGPITPSTWDISNLLAWEGYVHMGLVPMKDFFYPYGFQWLYTDGSAGPIYEWLIQVGIVLVAGRSLWLLSGGRALRVLACVLVIALAGPWAEAWRWVPALLVPVAYAAVGPARRPRQVSDHLLLFAACTLAAFVEPDLLGIGLAGSVLVLVGEFVAGRCQWQPRALLGALALDAVPFLAAVAVMLVIWVASGMAGGEIRFLSSLSAVSSQSATDESVGGAAGLMLGHLSAKLLYAAAPALLATAGLLWARLRREDPVPVAPVLLGAAGVSMMMLLLNFVRGIDDQVITSAMIALAWSMIMLWRRDSIRRIVISAAGVAAVVTMLGQVGGLSLTQYWDTATSAPGRVVRSVRVAFNSRERQTAAAAFDPARFQAWPDLAIANDFVRTVPSDPAPTFAIVGDAPLTYALLHQPPPYESELYDASPIAQQEHMLSLLERQPPRYVIWRRNGTVDIVPYDVRDPLVYAWMIEHYVPLRRYSSWDILRRRRPGEAIPARYWRTELGDGEDLGFIPSYSHAASSSRCSGGSGCVAYAVLRGSARTHAGVTFSVSGSAGSFTVRLLARSGVDTYPVRLDRLWFWPLMGAHPTLRSLTPGFTVRGFRLRSGDNLY